MLRQFLRLGLDQVDSEAKHTIRLDLAQLDFAHEKSESDEDSDRLISGIGEPVCFSQPMQLRIPPDRHMDDSGTNPCAKPYRAWQKNGTPQKAEAKDRGTPMKRMIKDGTPSKDEFKSSSDWHSISGYWVVRNLGRTKDKRGCACIGEMDTTSVFAFRMPVSASGRASGYSSRATSMSLSARPSAKPKKLGQPFDSPTPTYTARDREAEKDALVRYNEPVVLFTNYGVGGRFLAPTVSNSVTGVGGGQHRSRVAWQMTEEDIRASIIRRQQRRAGRTRVYAFENGFEVKNSPGQKSPISNDEDDSDSDDEISMSRGLRSSQDRLSKWVVRKAGQWPPKPWEDKQAYLGIREVIRCGDIIMLESFSMPGWYVKSKNCLTKLEKGTAGAEIQVMAPSLSFALSLRERTAQYTASAGNNHHTRRTGFNLRHMGITPRRENAPHPRNSIFMEKKLPYDLLRYAISFFAGLEGSYDMAATNQDARDVVKKQKIQNSVPFSVRRDGMNAIRAVRLTCQPWKDVANSLILSVKTGDMTELSSRHQRHQLISFILSCENLTKLSLRNLDCIRTSDLEPLHQLKYLRNLNVGGCYRICDQIAEIITQLPVVELNLAMTQITDVGLNLIIRNQPYLCVLNLYGCEGVTEIGLMELVSELPLLSQLNLRGTGITGQQAARLRRFCKSECEILTGQALQTSLFNKKTRSNFK